MTGWRGRAVALAGVAAVATLAWPGPATGASSLGGYSGYAQAIPLRVEIIDPVIPIPSSPQIDGGIALTRALTGTGPVSRALASYLWPGDVIGEGFDQLTGDPNSKYPVQVNSRNPATTDSPARNTAQLTDGNGMTTSAGDTTTRATVTGLGIAGPSTDLLGGLGAGLGQLGGSAPGGAGSSLPVPVGPVLAALATVRGVRSTSEVVVGSSSVTATARATAGTVSLLGGLVSLDGMDATSRTTSDGTRATPSGSVRFGAVTVAGQHFGFGDRGVSFGGTSQALPGVPAALRSLLKGLGVEITPFATTRSHTGATGSFSAVGLTVSLDTAPLKRLLNVSAITDPLARLVSTIPGLGSQLSPLLSLGPRIILHLGDVTSNATAAPAYTAGAVPTPTTSGHPSPVAQVSTNGGTSGGTGYSPGTPGTPGTPGHVIAAPVATVPTLAGYRLPALGAVPRALTLGGIVLALAIAWALRNAGALLFTPAACDRGSRAGVPDLRRGR